MTTGDEPRLSGFKAAPEALHIAFDKIVGTIRTVHLRTVPLEVVQDEVFRQSKEVANNQPGFQIPLQDEPAENEYSIFVFADQNWFELVRQSSRWLKMKFDFDKSGGYTILGRRSISVAGGSKPVLGLLVFRGQPDLSEVSPTGNSDFPEVRLATGLFSFLWQQPLKQGPTSQSYSEYLEQPFHTKLERIRSGDFAVMCQGMRDLFLHASAGVRGLKVRAVEAFNYASHFRDLIPYGHSTSEVWVEDLEKWVLFDVWLGVMIVDRAGVPVGASDLQRAPADCKIVALAEEMPRMVQRSDGTIVSTTYRPSSTRLTEFSCYSEGCSPGFVEYFRHLIYRDHELKSRSVFRIRPIWPLWSRNDTDLG